MMSNMIFDIGANQNVDVIELKKFNLFSSTIASSYQHFFSGKIKKIIKISVDLYQHEIPMKICNYEQTQSIAVIFRTFDFKEFYNNDKQTQKKIILDTLQDSILQMCLKFELDKTPFENAYNKVIENNYTNKYYFKKPTLSKSRKHKAGIEVDMSENGTDINIVFTDTEGTILARKSVFKTHSHFYFIHQLINSGKWIDNERYMASNKKKNVNFIASLNSNKIELDIQPKEKEKEIVEKLNELRYE